MKKKKQRKINPLSIEFDLFKESSCTSKKSYSSQWEADIVAQEAYKKYGKVLHCYECKICGGYHLTESNKDYGNRIF